MTKECLVCNATSAPTALLCHQCGAPLPESDATNLAQKTTLRSRGRSTYRKRYLLVAGMGVLALSLVVFAVVWTGSKTSSPEDALARLPNHMSAVGAWNIKQLWSHDALKNVWNNPLVAQYVGLAKAQVGVDVRAIKTMLAGSRTVDDGLEFLYVEEGSFVPDKLGAAIRTLCPTDIMISDHRLSLCDLSAIADNNNSASNSENSTAVPESVTMRIPTIKRASERMSSIAFGAWDENHVVAGTPAIIEAYFTGGEQVGDNPDMQALLADIDSHAFAWGAIDLERTSSDLATLLPFLSDLPALKGTAITFQLLLRDVLKLDADCILQSAEAAQAIKPLAQVALDAAIRTANERLAIIGRTDALSGTIESVENRLILRAQLVLPSLGL